MKKTFFLLILVFLFSGCVIEGETTYQWEDDPVTDSIMAELALTNFLSLLNQQQYEQAVQYYGGSYSELYDLNPEVKREYKAILLQRYCTVNNGACLIPEIIAQDQTDDNNFQFTVVFYDQDNNVYKTPGCSCRGGGKSEFQFIVEKNTPQFLVKNLPPINQE